MNVWFIADTHFCHGNILKHCHRPFGSVQDHDQELIRRWNSLVQPKDEVYHLGDVAFQSNPQFLCDKILNKLNGRIFLIKGNHDKNVIRGPALERFVWVKDVYSLKIQPSVVHGAYGDQPLEFFLSHYAHRVWNKSHHGVPHLYGHSHGGLPAHGKSFDVGVDCWDFYPISLETVMEKLKTL